MAKDVVTASPFDTIDVGIEHVGKQITLPADPQAMTYKEAAKVLLRKDKEDEELVQISDKFDNVFYYDGLIAFNKAMREVFGWIEAVPTPSFFGPQPPEIVTISVSPSKRIEVFTGMFSLPGVEGKVYAGFYRKEGRILFQCGGEVKRKHAHVVRLLAEKTREIIKRESIYRGKAIIIRTDIDGGITNDAPQFFDTTGADKMELIFSQHVGEQIFVNLFTPIRYTEKARQLRIPLKRGVLLAGKYGTGKTLTATKVAHECEQNGWTFILLDRVGGLRDALALARMYSPAVVFAEDIDRAMAGQERTQAIDDILNTIDGVESKNSEIITVLTTNHLDEINQAMLRPGRLDAVIEITPPDADAARRLMRLYGAGQIAETDALIEAGAELDGQIPATIREAVERAKLYAIFMSGGVDTKITDAALAASARQMKEHLRLLNRDTNVEEQHTVEYRVGAALRDLIVEQDMVDVNIDLDGNASVQNIRRGVGAANLKLDKIEEAATVGVIGQIVGMKEQLGKLDRIKEDTETTRRHVVGE